MVFTVGDGTDAVSLQASFQGKDIPMNHPFLPHDHNKTCVQVTQRIEDFDTPRAEDPRFPRKRIRSFLKCHGFRGPALESECDRVMAGPPPQSMLAEISGGVIRKYPYGWEQRHLPRLWRRMFHGTRHSLLVPFCLDEFHIAMPRIEG